MERRYSLLAWILFVVAILPLSAQEKGEPIVIGSEVKFRSKILGEERRIFVSLPDGYTDSQERYPVLYMLYSLAPDFHFNTGVVAGLSRMQMIPRMITVGFDLGDGMRDLTPTKSPDYGPNSGGAGRFLQYIKNELIPFIEENYRAAPERLFWSHSIGGLFGLYTLLEEPDVFQSVLVSSPYFIYDREERYIIKNTRTFLNRRKRQNNFLYICAGDEPRLLSEIETFLEMLDNLKPEGLTWNYVKMPGENHMSILARSLTEGLRAFGRK
jgi:predicted alpha/beta superfamily hydrolase